jgi:hypothetical protein
VVGVVALVVAVLVVCVAVVVCVTVVVVVWGGVVALWVVEVELLRDAGAVEVLDVLELEPDCVPGPPPDARANTATSATTAITRTITA